MKTKLTSLLLAVLMLFGLCACGGASDKNVDLQAFYDTLASEYDFSAMSELSADMISATYPGLADIKTTQLIARAPMITSVVSEIVLVECETEDGAKQAETILQERAKTQAEGGAWYPESMEAWAKAKTVRSGRYVCLIAHESADAISRSFDELFK